MLQHTPISATSVFHWRKISTRGNTSKVDSSHLDRTDWLADWLTAAIGHRKNPTKFVQGPASERHRERGARFIQYWSQWLSLSTSRVHSSRRHLSPLAMHVSCMIDDDDDCTNRSGFSRATTTTTAKGTIDPSCPWTAAGMGLPSTLRGCTNHAIW